MGSQNGYFLSYKGITLSSVLCTTLVNQRVSERSAKKELFQRKKMTKLFFNRLGIIRIENTIFKEPILYTLK